MWFIILIILPFCGLWLLLLLLYAEIMDSVWRPTLQQGIVLYLIFIKSDLSEIKDELHRYDQ